MYLTSLYFLVPLKAESLIFKIRRIAHLNNFIASKPALSTGKSL
jgi:hypothetical protein